MRFHVTGSSKTLLVFQKQHLQLLLIVPTLFYSPSTFDVAADSKNTPQKELQNRPQGSGLATHLAAPA